MQYPSKEIIDALRHQYHAGSRVILEFMDDPAAPPTGTEGKVIMVDDVGTVHIAWQTGSSLGIAYGADRCRRIDDD